MECPLQIIAPGYERLEFPETGFSVGGTGHGTHHAGDVHDYDIGFGCAEPTKETVGTGAGAAIGGIIGSEVGDGTTGTVVGGVVGALIGREVGRRMDERDRENARTAFEENRTVNWDNPDTDTEYTVQPTDTFERDGRTCRRYNTTVEIEGDTETATGTACRRDDGTWEIIS